MDLASNIDENNYSTEILSPDLSIQQAPPSFCSASATITTTNNRSLSDNSACGDQRFGTKTAVYAQWYPNIMLNRYGPWFDVDIVIPIDATTSRILKAWFLEADFELPSSSYIDTSLASSQQVHDEDVFLCENVQVGLQSRGFDMGRYVPSKQIATFHFHQRLARDLRRFVQ